MMLHPNNSLAALGVAGHGLARHSKRKAADVPEGNERLSKRLSLLNLENSGAKLYVPVENAWASPATHPAPAAVPPRPPSPAQPPSPQSAHSVPSAVLPRVPATTLENGAAPTAIAAGGDDGMQVDNTKYKVYIYDIDDELDDDGDAPAANGAGTDSADADAGKLVFLADIDKHLRAAARDVALAGSGSAASAAAASALPPRKLAVPRPIVPNKDGELAGMQLVLYSDPSSISVPRENDSVRKAILDARARIRERQHQEESETKARHTALQPVDAGVDVDVDADASMASTPVPGTPAPDDPDAMDID